MNICKHKDCLGSEKPVRSGYCPAHYQQMRRKNRTIDVGTYGKDRYCLAPECEQKHFARNLCRTHYTYWMNGNCPSDPDERCEVSDCAFKRVVNELCAGHASMTWYRSQYEKLSKYAGEED